MTVAISYIVIVSCIQLCTVRLPIVEGSCIIIIIIIIIIDYKPIVKLSTQFRFWMMESFQYSSAFFTMLHYSVAEKKFYDSQSWNGHIAALQWLMNATGMKLEMTLPMQGRYLYSSVCRDSSCIQIHGAWSMIEVYRRRSTCVLFVCFLCGRYFQLCRSS